MVEPNTHGSVAADIDDGLGKALIYAVSTLHCLPQCLAHDGEGLGAAWGPKKAEEYCRRAGRRAGAPRPSRASPLARTGFASFERLAVDNQSNSFYGVRAKL